MCLHIFKEEIMLNKRILQYVRLLTPEQFKSEICDGVFAENVLSHKVSSKKYKKIKQFNNR